MGDNLAISPTSDSTHPALVIGTELEPRKAAIARQHVSEAFGSLPPHLSLLEGDLLQTLPQAQLADRSIDALLLDTWSPLALPTLRIMLPKLRRGAAVFIDNTVASRDNYRDLLGFLRDPENGFMCSTLPHDGGFELCVYDP